jgi:UPF0716 family protein affecting phage T7 exclusion
MRKQKIIFINKYLFLFLKAKRSMLVKQMLDEWLNYYRSMQIKDSSTLMQHQQQITNNDYEDEEEEEEEEDDDEDDDDDDDDDDEEDEDDSKDVINVINVDE